MSSHLDLDILDSLDSLDNIDILLASGSPRRRELLKELGWKFRVAVPQVDESPLPGESPDKLCLRLAATKAQAVAKTNAAAAMNEKLMNENLMLMNENLMNENLLIIAADTVVVVDGDVLGKPRNEEESLKMIERLQGRTHEVLTGLGVRWKGRATSALERTWVCFRPLNEAAMRAYVKTGEGLDKAGAYAIQGKGALLVSSIEGDYFNVVGLPLCRLAAMLEALGLDLPRLWRMGRRCF
ncbi:MAG: Maf family protein [Synergistaceae bacterium]|jgi:septum formation protein|nr:Maf family protein [Synergistaceae bacterium]